MGGAYIENMGRARYGKGRPPGRERTGWRGREGEYLALICQAAGHDLVFG